MLESLFPVFVILWLLIAFVIVRHNWRREHDGVGIVIVYTILFAVTHWLNALITSLPWYTSAYDTRLIKLGFSQALIPKWTTPRQPLASMEVIAVERVEEAFAHFR